MNLINKIRGYIMTICQKIITKLFVLNIVLLYTVLPVAYICG